MHRVMFTTVRARTRPWIDQAFAGSSGRNRGSCPLWKSKNSLGIFYLKIVLRSKPTQCQAKVKKEKVHTAHDGKSDSETERMMFG